MAEYLARAGVARLTLCDKGSVKPDTMARQPYDDEHIGLSKADALSRRLKTIVPAITIDALTSDVIELMRTDDWADDVDLLMDCTASRSVRLGYESWRLSQDTVPPAISMMIDGDATCGMVITIASEYSGGIFDAFRQAKLQLSRRKPNQCAWLDAFFSE